MDTQHCQDRCSPPCHISFSHPPYFIISLAAAFALHAAAVFLFVNLFTLKPNQTKKPQIYSVSIFSLEKGSKHPLPKKTSKPKHSGIKKPRQKEHRFHLKEKKTHVRKKHIKKRLRSITSKSQKHKKIEKAKKPSAPVKGKALANAVAANRETPKKKQISHKEGNSGKRTKNLKGKNKTKAKTKILISEDGYPSIYSWIASHKFYPIEALFKDEQGRITAMFTINRGGTITGIKISKGSFRSLNKATVKIIENSSPIPKKILEHSNLKLPATVILKLVFKINS